MVAPISSTSSAPKENASAPEFKLPAKPQAEQGPAEADAAQAPPKPAAGPLTSARSQASPTGQAGDGGEAAPPAGTPAEAPPPAQAAAPGRSADPAPRPTETPEAKGGASGRPAPGSGEAGRLGGTAAPTADQVLGDLPNIDPVTGARRASTPATGSRDLLEQARQTFGPAPTGPFAGQEIKAADPNGPVYEPRPALDQVPGEVAGFVYETATALPGVTTLAGQGLNAVTGYRGLEDAGRAWQRSVDDFYVGPEGVFRHQAKSVEFEDGRMLSRVADLAGGGFGAGAGTAARAGKALGRLDDASDALRVASGTPVPSGASAAPAGAPQGSVGAAVAQNSPLNPANRPPTPEQAAEQVLAEVAARRPTAQERLAADPARLPAEVREAIQGGAPPRGLPTSARQELAAVADELSRGREPDLSHLQGHSFFDPDTNRSYYQDPQTNRLRAFDPGDYVTTYDPKTNTTSILRHDDASDAVESVPFGQGDNRLPAERGAPSAVDPGSPFDSRRIGPFPSPLNVDAIDATLSRLGTTVRDRLGRGGPVQDYPLADPANPPAPSTRDIDSVGKPVKFDELSNDNAFTDPIGRALAGRGNEARLIESGPRAQGSGPFAQTRFFMTLEDVKNFLNQPTRDEVVRMNPEADLMLPRDFGPQGLVQAGDFAYRPGQGTMMEAFDVNAPTQILHEVTGAGVKVNKVNFFEISSNRNGPDGTGAVKPVDTGVSPSGQALNVAFDQERNVYVLQEDLEVKATKQVQFDVGPIKTRVIDYPGSNGGYGLIRRGTEFTPSEMAYLEDGLRHPVQYASEGAPKDPAHRYDLFRVRITDGPVPGLPTPTFLEKIEFPNRPDGAAVRRLDAGLKLPAGPGHGVEAGYVWKFALREGMTAPENASRVVTLGSDLARVDDTVLDQARSRRPGDVTVVNVLPSEARAPDGARTVTGFALDNAMAPAVTGTSGSWTRESHDAVMAFLNGLDEASNPAVSRAYAVFGRSPATGRITNEQSDILKAVLRGEVAKAETRPTPRAAAGE